MIVAIRHGRCSRQVRLFGFLWNVNCNASLGLGWSHCAKGHISPYNREAAK